ncbi:helix-turn-helix transcriptional regulator [Methylocystis sp. H4A]|uniref:helix-turn-helix transcriptional regulator n=1 Tax=Methylocystis sp. H4A TaxID=2785788 RepID=UPI0018C1E6B1|nr:AraC family transcriptional regulator [Methylocystis sp. H4A]MBG0800944.1 helix-turn-helix transcriptional regulator [Methylocystis sp. H4A]
MSKFTFSSDSLPERDRLEATSHFVSALGGKTTIKPYSEDFHFRLEGGAFAGMYWVAARGSSMLVDCAGEGQLADFIAIGFNRIGYGLRYRGADMTLQSGDAGLRMLGLPAVYTSVMPIGGVAVAFPAEEIFRRLRTKDCAFAPLLRGVTPGLQLLRQYLDGLEHDGVLSNPAEQWLFASHVLDLLALVLGANADALEQARRGGVRAARLKVAKDYIDAHLLDTDLSDQTVAAHLCVSDRYVRLLFSDEGMSCKSYIDRQRLAKAYAMLSNPVSAGLKIIDLAYRCGFNDITTFNRQFRTRYGMTPSEAREGRWVGGGGR